MLTQSATLPARPQRGTFKAWHALACFIGFFGFMFAVNGIFLWTAIKTFPGEDVEKSYLTGLDYNQELARRERQSREGWSAAIGLDGSAPQPEIRIRLTGNDGRALPAAAVSLQMRHPADRALDRAVDLVPVGGGEYAAPLNGLAPGLWTAQFSADVDPSTDGNEFSASREVIVP